MATVAAGARRMCSHERFVIRVAIVAGICGLLRLRNGGHLGRAAVCQERFQPLALDVECCVQHGSGGRRRMLIVASLLPALAPSAFWLAAGRLFVGVAIGVCAYTAPLYVSEISPAHNRGALRGDSSVLPHGLRASREHWRWMFTLATVPAMILGIGMIFLPESPRWLVSVGQRDRARQVLERVRAPQEAESEMQLIKSSRRANRFFGDGVQRDSRCCPISRESALARAPNGSGLPQWAAFDEKHAQTIELGDHCGARPIAPKARFDFFTRDSFSPGGSGPLTQGLRDAFGQRRETYHTFVTRIFRLA
jgi:hypothetical protein